MYVNWLPSLGRLKKKGGEKTTSLVMSPPVQASNIFAILARIS